jgi:hypothetical protein
MPMTPWGYGGFGNGGGDDPRMRQQQPAPAMPAAAQGGPGGGAPPAWGGGGMGMGMNPWLQGLAQRIAAARAQWQQRMPQHQHPMMGGGGEHEGMGMPWMRGGPPQGVMPQGAPAGAPGAPPAAAAAQGGGGGMFAPGWANRFAAPGVGQPGAPPPAAAAATASPVKPPQAGGDNASDGDADDEKRDE